MSSSLWSSVTALGHLSCSHTTAENWERMGRTCPTGGWSAGSLHCGRQNPTFAASDGVARTSAAHSHESWCGYQHCDHPPVQSRRGRTCPQHQCLFVISLTTTANSSVFSHFHNIHRWIPKTFIWRSFEGLSQLPDMILLMYLPNQPPSPISWALLRSSGLMLQLE